MLSLNEKSQYLCLEQCYYGIERSMSYRLACASMQVSLSGLTHRLKISTKDASVIEAMKRLSATEDHTSSEFL